MRSNHIPDQIRFHSENKTRVNNFKPFQTYPHWTGNPSSLELAAILPCSTAGDDGFRAQCASPALNSDMYSSSRLPWDAQEQLDSSENLMTWIFLNFSISIIFYIFLSFSHIDMLWLWYVHIFSQWFSQVFSPCFLQLQIQALHTSPHGTRRHEGSASAAAACPEAHHYI